MPTRGELACEKLGNFMCYIEVTTGFVPEERVYEQLTPLRAVVFCRMIADHKEAVATHSFDALQKIPQLPPSVVAGIDAVVLTPAAHNKFWRYMDLFVELAEA